MSERKYIILKNDDTGKEYAVIFDRDLSHSAVARGVIGQMSRNDWGPHMYLDAVSAGFVDAASCVIPGRGSESLKLEPRAVDQIVINGGQPMSDATKAALTEMARKITAPKRSLLERSKGARAR